MVMLTEDTTRSGWLDQALAWSLRRRIVVLLLAAGLLVWGFYRLAAMPVDVLPDLTTPTVTLLVDAPGLTAEETEKLVAVPLETSLNGAGGVQRIRSSVVPGFAVLWVSFKWNTNLYLARQIVNERIQHAVAQFPKQAKAPVLAPISSIMGEVMFLAFHSKKHSLRQVRTTVDRLIRRRLLGVSGVAQVTPIGGEVKQYQVLLSPHKLRHHKLTPKAVCEAIEKANGNRWGGLLVMGGREFSIEALGRISNKKALKDVVVAVRKGVPVTLEQVAVVQVGQAFRRGVASFNGQEAVVLGIQKQPRVNTLTLTQRLDQTLDTLAKTLPKGYVIERKGFRQARFIEVSIHNVQRALLEGAILVVLVLMLFLVNVRATVISVMAIPLSLITAFLLLEMLGATVNTMTLGGLTVAIGALVDDAVIDVENIFRRLQINNALVPELRQSPIRVVFEASKEIRTSILFATLILMLVFLPIFFLSGIEGRLLRPLGLAYLISIFASLLVALTVTPVLSYYLLSKNPKAVSHGESFLVRWLQRLYRPVLEWSLRHPKTLIFFSVGLFVAAMALFPFLGRSFLPPFNEGSLTVAVTTLPGTSLQKSAEFGERVEKVMMTFPEVVATTRRTGRGELDEHVQGVYAGELDVVLKMKKRSMREFLHSFREKLAAIPGVVINIGQPISHRIDHMLSGSRSAVAIKLYGPDLLKLRELGEQIKAQVATVSGLVDVGLESMIQVPQYQVLPRPFEAKRYGLSPGVLMSRVEHALHGAAATHILEGQNHVGVWVRYNHGGIKNRKQLEDLPIFTPTGAVVPLRQVARIRYGWGPNRINREAGQRRIIISANTSKADLVGLVQQAQRKIQTLSLPQGYYVEYGGQFEREATARQTMLVLSLVVLVAILWLLQLAFGSFRLALLILVNLPLALIGGVFLLFVTGQVVSVAALVGWITLFGIATRNGIILISHYQHLWAEKMPLWDTVVQGSLERLNPVLMTALTTGLAMLPLMWASGKPGNELQSPMAFVIFGGLFSATLLNLLLLPVLYFRYANPASEGTQD
ncbi:MAG: efflux RND transporter permease subunit [Deltaproteobacteria bacterium]|nr:MAG: efflux RND transporter permease subunit [Deltaproteobacteria bacterium]